MSNDKYPTPEEKLYYEGEKKVDLGDEKDLRERPGKVPIKPVKSRKIRVYNRHPYGEEETNA